MKKESPVTQFPGYVILPDYLTFPQVFAFEDAIEAAQAHTAEDESIKDWRRYFYAMLPGLLKCVNEWHIAGIPEQPTPETFPATPQMPVAELAGWLIGEVTALLNEAREVPLAQ